jgi:hypothetical protein
MHVKTMVMKDDDKLTHEDMVEWLQREIRDLSKQTELRVKDATDFVTAYAMGKVTEKEMRERLSVYHHRWGDSPIPGVTTQEGMTDEEIMKRLDAALPKTVREIIKRHLAKPEGPGPNRQ